MYHITARPYISLAMMPFVKLVFKMQCFGVLLVDASLMKILSSICSRG